MFVALFLCFFSHALFGEESYILCIDGGGSKTILQVLDQAGRFVPLTKDSIVNEKMIAPGSNINVIGREGVQTVLHDLFGNVTLNQGAVVLRDILPRCRLVAGMPGVGLPKNKQTVISLFEEWGLQRDQICVMSDAELALQLIDTEGIVLISGTGSICFGKKNQGLYRVGGLGRILGDEGSGYQIGLSALKAALAHEYGWGIPTTLTSSLKEFFHVTELKNIIPSITLGEVDPATIANCVPFVFQQAQEHDAVAAEIINRAAHDLGTLVATQVQLSYLTNCELHIWGDIFKTPSADRFIQRIMNSALAICKEHCIEVVNHAHDNAAVLYALKYLLH
jgi:N-acetylglucosamine kinase-like BadF-type ATPase